MQRTVKSFVLRSGRLSSRQQLALDEWLSHYALPEPGTVWNFSELFTRSADVIVEIGFGMGGTLLATAKANPDINYIGIEVHRPGIGALAAALHQENITNVRIAGFDAVAVFNTCIADDALKGVNIFFPDPWPKKRHHKRRLIQSDFIRLIASKLKQGGVLHCATDWQDYAEQMMNVLSAEPMLRNLEENGGYFPRPEERLLTKFEQRGLRLGHQVWDLLFQRLANAKDTP